MSAPFFSVGRRLLRFVLTQRVLSHLHDPSRELVGRADQLFGHLERRIDDLATRAVLTHFGEDAVDSVKKPPDCLERGLLSVFDRVADASKAVVSRGRFLSWL
jgi:hypothetical protein